MDINIIDYGSNWTAVSIVYNYCLEAKSVLWYYDGYSWIAMTATPDISAKEIEQNINEEDHGGLRYL